MLPPFENTTAATAMMPTPIQIAHQSSLRNNSFQADAPSTELRGARTTDSVTVNSSDPLADHHRPFADCVPIAAGHDRLPIGYEVACTQGERPLHAKCALVEANCALDREIRSEERRVGKECRSRWSPYH